MVPLRRALSLALLAVALFVPFSIAGTNIALGFVALLWIALVAVDRTARARALSRPGLFAIAAIVLVLSALPSALLSQDRARAMNDFASYWQLVICFVVASAATITGVRGRALVVLLASAALSCAVAFVQRSGGVHVGFLHIGGEHRAGSTMYTMTFAGILYQLILLAAALACTRGLRPLLRGALIVSVMVTFSAELITMTRGAWLALVVGLLSLALLIRNRVTLIAGALLVAALAGYSFMFAGDQGRTISPVALFTSSPDRNVGTRLVLWDTAWDMFREHPVLGVGMGDYTPEARQRLEGREVRTAVDAHNIPLQILATRGLLGFLPFVLYWIALFRALVRRRGSARAGSVARYAATGAIAATIALLAGSLTENNIDDSEVFMCFMFIVGLALAHDRPGGDVPTT